MKKNKAGIGRILTGQAKIDHEERVRRQEEELAVRAAAKNAGRLKRRLNRALAAKPPGPPPPHL